MEKPPFNLQPVLESELLTLRPLAEHDFEGLYSVAADPLVWEQHPARDRWERKVFEALFKDAMQSGGALAVVDKATGKIIGSTRFHVVNGAQNAIEIGWTFLARQYWGGRYNGSMKELMINYAFGFVQHVLFFIGETNTRSQKAVEKIGGKRITMLGQLALEPRASASVIYHIDKESWEKINQGRTTRNSPTKTS